MSRCRLIGCALAIGSLLWVRSSPAEGPDVSSLLPAGGQRGSTVPIIAKGSFPNWPAQAWFDSPGLTASPGDDKGKLNVSIADDAAPGLHWLRLFDQAGTSSPLPFVVGTLAEVVEQEPNDAPKQAQELGSSSIVVNGRLQRPGDVDLFAVPLKQGQTLVASLAGHEQLGSPMDAVLHVVSSAGRQLAYNHDQRGLDPEIIFTARAEGDYLVRVLAFPSTPNSTIGFSGGESYVYRLTLTTAGFVDYAWPLAVMRDRETPVQLAGWNLPESLLMVPIEASGDTFAISDAQFGNVTTVAVEPHETLIETEPNDRDHPQAIALPATVTGRIESPGDIDAYAFVGKQGESLLFKIQSRELGYPLDGILEIIDATGKSLAKVDDVGNGRDPLIAFTPPADGPYRIAVSDLNRQGSARHVYRFQAIQALPTFKVSADTPAYAVTPDKPAEISLAFDRQNGFAEEIDVTVAGLPAFVTAAPGVSPPTGDAAKTVKLTLTSAGGNFSGPIRVTATSRTSKVARTATAAIPNHAARITELWLTASGAKE